MLKGIDPLSLWVWGNGRKNLISFRFQTCHPVSSDANEVSFPMDWCPTALPFHNQILDPFHSPTFFLPSYLQFLTNYPNPSSLWSPSNCPAAQWSHLHAITLDFFRQCWPSPLQCPPAARHCGQPALPLWGGQQPNFPCPSWGGGTAQMFALYNRPFL